MKTQKIATFNHLNKNDLQNTYNSLNRLLLSATIRRNSVTLSTQYIEQYRKQFAQRNPRTQAQREKAVYMDNIKQYANIAVATLNKSIRNNGTGKNLHIDVITDLLATAQCTAWQYHIDLLQPHTDEQRTAYRLVYNAVCKYYYNTYVSRTTKKQAVNSGYINTAHITATDDINEQARAIYYLDMYNLHLSDIYKALAKNKDGATLIQVFDSLIIDGNTQEQTAKLLNTYQRKVSRYLDSIRAMLKADNLDTVYTME